MRRPSRRQLSARSRISAGERRSSKGRRDGTGVVGAPGGDGIERIVTGSGERSTRGSAQNAGQRSTEPAEPPRWRCRRDDDTGGAAGGQQVTSSAQLGIFGRLVGSGSRAQESESMARRQRYAL